MYRCVPMGRDRAHAHTYTCMCTSIHYVPMGTDRTHTCIYTHACTHTYSPLSTKSSLLTHYYSFTDVYN